MTTEPDYRSPNYDRTTIYLPTNAREVSVEEYTEFRNNLRNTNLPLRHFKHPYNIQLMICTHERWWEPTCTIVYSDKDKPRKYYIEG